MDEAFLNLHLVHFELAELPIPSGKCLAIWEAGSMLRKPQLQNATDLLYQDYEQVMKQLA